MESNYENEERLAVSAIKWGLLFSGAFVIALAIGFALYPDVMRWLW